MFLDPIFHRGLVLLPYPAVQLGQHIQGCWLLEEKLGGTDAVASSPGFHGRQRPWGPREVHNMQKNNGDTFLQSSSAHVCFSVLGGLDPKESGSDDGLWFRASLVSQCSGQSADWSGQVPPAPQKTHSFSSPKQHKGLIGNMPRKSPIFDGEFYPWKNGV